MGNEKTKHHKIIRVLPQAKHAAKAVQIERLISPHFLDSPLIFLKHRARCARHSVNEFTAKAELNCLSVLKKKERKKKRTTQPKALTTGLDMKPYDASALVVADLVVGVCRSEETPTFIPVDVVSAGECV